MVFYADLDERKRLHDEGLARDERIIHDDHLDEDGKPTDGLSGTLTFEATKPPEPLTAEEVDARAIEAKASPTLAELVRLLRFTNVIRSN